MGAYPGTIRVLNLKPLSSTCCTYLKSITVLIPISYLLGKFLAQGLNLARKLPRMYEIGMKTVVSFGLVHQVELEGFGRRPLLRSGQAPTLDLVGREVDFPTELFSHDYCSPLWATCPDPTPQLALTHRHVELPARDAIIPQPQHHRHCSPTATFHPQCSSVNASATMLQAFLPQYYTPKVLATAFWPQGSKRDVLMTILHARRSS